MPLRQRLSVLAITAVVAGSSLALTSIANEPAAASAAESASFTPRSGPIGQHPRASGASVSPIRRAILDNIAHTPARSTIRMVTWHFDDEGIANALIRAHDRQVHVQVLLRGESCDNPNVWINNLRLRLTGHSSFQCIQRSARGDKGELHQKSFTFSRTGTASYVSLVTSYNPTRDAIDFQYNVAFQFVNNATLYGDLARLFQQQKADTALPVRCGTSDPNDGRLFQHFFNGYGVIAHPMDCATEDPVVTRLRTIPNPDDAVIRVATSGFTYERAKRIATQLAKLRKAGAWVKVIHTAGAGPEVRKILNDGRVSHLDTQACGDEASDDRSFNHSKMLLVSFVGASGTRAYRSWVGSDNFAENSINNDELMVQVSQQAHYKSFAEFFDFTWSRELRQEQQGC